MCSQINKLKKKIKSTHKIVIKNANNIINNLRGSYQFKKNDIFEPPFEVKISKISKEISQDYSGIYIFVVEDEIENKENFNKVYCGSKINNSKEDKTNDRKIENRYVLYIGKTFKMKTRLSNHITDDAETSNSSLKLGTPDRRFFLENENNTVIIYKLKESLSNSEISTPILAITEKHLHNLINPLVGSSR